MRKHVCHESIDDSKSNSESSDSEGSNAIPNDIPQEGTDFLRVGLPWPDNTPLSYVQTGLLNVIQKHNRPARANLVATRAAALADAVESRFDPDIGIALHRFLSLPRALRKPTRGGKGQDFH